VKIKQIKKDAGHQKRKYKAMYPEHHNSEKNLETVLKIVSVFCWHYMLEQKSHHNSLQVHP